eukprot:SAG31_NODE_827_length_11749_cov_14.363090_2_plen_40_part_00
MTENVVENTGDGCIAMSALIAISAITCHAVAQFNYSSRQ